MGIFENKAILVTGGTGSLGKVLVRRILSGEEGVPKKLIVFSRDEAKQHDMRQEFLHKRGTEESIYNNFLERLEFRIGDVRDYSSLCQATKKVDIIVNAAALKQVPSCEYFPHEAVMTNVIGSINLVRAISEHNLPVQTVIGVSTDKACKPINVMGMTKSVQEKVFVAANITNPETRYVCVRYGNVLASRGSVIPLFHQQIKAGGPVTITTPDMTRFLLSLNKAVDTIYAAIKHAAPGETVVPRIQSTKIVNIARALIGDRQVDVVETGIRPGEKIHEIMVSEEEGVRTYEKRGFFFIQPMLPELVRERSSQYLNKEYSSEFDLMSFEETCVLMREHGLLLDQAGAPHRFGEMLA
ncbi:MAG: polysaccharide biosynthesis protein [Bdellovibrionales bacterium]